MKAAFIFAHYDDAILSAANLMSSAEVGSVDLTLCTAIPHLTARERVSSSIRALLGLPRRGMWDEECGFTDPAQAMAARKREHEQATRLFGLETFGLDGLDGQYGTMDIAHERQCADLAFTICESRQIDTIVTHPLWATHPDHQRTARIARIVGAELGIEMLTVCERPYTDCSEGCNTPDGVALESNSTILDESVWQSKLRGVALYRTQISALERYFPDGWMQRSRLGRECVHRIHAGEPRGQRYSVRAST